MSEIGSKCRVERKDVKYQRSQNRKNTAKRDKIVIAKRLRIAAICLAGLESLLAAMLVFLIWRLNILIWLQATVVTGVILLVSLVFIINAVRKQTSLAVRVAAVITSAVLLITFGLADFNLFRMVNFLDETTRADSYETQTYIVITKKESEINDISALSGKTIGFQKANSRFDLANEKLAEVIDFQVKTYDDLAVMLRETKTDKLPAFVITEALLGSLREENEGFDETWKVIFDFEIRYEREVIKTNTVNIASDPFIVYLSGNDDGDKGLAEADRSLINMLIVVNPEQQKILLVAVPSEYYVQLHGVKGAKDRLAHASIYGTIMSQTTMEDLFDIEIMHTIKMDFSKIEDIINVLGGIEVESDKTFVAEINEECKIETGVQALNGACALAFAREIKAYATGDSHRALNQQAVLMATFEKIVQPENLSKIGKILKMANGILKTSMSYDELTELIREQLKTMGNWEVEAIGLGGTIATRQIYSMGSQTVRVMLPDDKAVRTVRKKILQYMQTDGKE